jgi:exodeoxyribonuclease-1
VFNEENQTRLNLSLKTIKAHAKLLHEHPEFCETVEKVVELLDQQQQMRFLGDTLDADERLYDHFIGDKDKTAMRKIQAGDFEVIFEDDRLTALLPLYKARNFPATLADEERAEWERFRERKLLGGKAESRAARYFQRLATLAEGPKLTDAQRYLLEELQLYGQSILPVET